jgi:CspA family cold shock protein
VHIQYVILTNATKGSRIASGILVQPAEFKKGKEYIMAKGTIRRIMDRGYGFIKTDQEEDLFFHRNSLEGVEFNSLSEGQAVEFEKGQGRDGRPAAVKVRLAETQAETQVDDSGDDKGDDDGDSGDDGGNGGS